jgi:hypothetical protein
MTVINRRNAVLGWAVWQFVTRAAKRRAKSAVPTGENGSKWRKRAAVAGAGAAAAGAAVVFWRKAGSDGASPPDE